MEDGHVLSDGALTVGEEIAHGANGVVHDAMLLGVRVCAKVRRRHGRRAAGAHAVSQTVF
jgi:hypothetical protein